MIFFQLQNESGFSNSSMQLDKGYYCFNLHCLVLLPPYMHYSLFIHLKFTGNDLVEEEIDIGGNEPPVSSYPPVEIEKDIALQSNECVNVGGPTGNSGWAFNTLRI